MFVTFWGTRGSVPASFNSQVVQGKLTAALKRFGNPSTQVLESMPFALKGSYGTNTACVEIEDSDGDILLCDGGTGLRDFSQAYLVSPASKESRTFHIFLSHLHWDHIQGFPFFEPAYIKGNRIIIHTCHSNAEYALRTQMSHPFFPFSFNDLQAKVEFDVHVPLMPFDVNGFLVTAIEQSHPGGSYGFRFERQSKTIVYSTDSEHPQSIDPQTYPFVTFFNKADLLIFDGQYSADEVHRGKKDWGHSSPEMGIRLASMAQVQHLVIFHLQSTHTDEALDHLLEETLRYTQEGSLAYPGYPKKVSFAYDGLKLKL